MAECKQVKGGWISRQGRWIKGEEDTEGGVGRKTEKGEFRERERAEQSWRMR
jgi:hypothetical protein